MMRFSHDGDAMLLKSEPCRCRSRNFLGLLTMKMIEPKLDVMFLFLFHCFPMMTINKIKRPLLMSPRIYGSTEITDVFGFILG